MRSHRFGRLREIVLRAITLPEADRPAFLDEACADDAELRRQVETLLAREHVEPAGVRTGGAVQFLTPRTGDPPEAIRSEPALRQIGPHRILRTLGSGGMGEVFLAEQQAPIRRQVALKLIRRGMDSHEVAARFESERQALALMSHACVARVFDAGTTEQGRPYFAMEYVEGEPITRYCDAHRLRIPERLELFVRVCEGVQHAHQRGIIHRDLKPSNVLVQTEDDRPVPKIIDFGVAKAMEQSLTDRQIETRAGMLIGTPQYMSPEQIALGGLDVDTRTDVYSLGVLLYEILVGAPPFEFDREGHESFDAIRNRVREEEPTRPSARVALLGQALEATACRRGADGSGLTRRLSGELDWIVLKALEKDRERRYGSPAELAEDVRRHLRDEPVVAGPPSAIYRVRKFARRHRGGLTAAAALLVVLLAGIVGTTVGMLRAREEAEYARTQAAIANEVNAFLNRDLLASVDPANRGIEVTVREVLDAAATQVEGRFEGAPRVEAQVRRTIGATYGSLARYQDARQQLEAAVALLQAELGPAHPDTLAAERDLAKVLLEQGHPREGGELLQNTLQSQVRVLGADHPTTLGTQARFVAHLIALGRLDEARTLAQRTLTSQRRVLGADHEDLSGTLVSLATIHERSGELAEAREVLEGVRERDRERRGPEHPGTVNTVQQLAGVYAQLGLIERADAMYREVIEIRRRTLGSEHRQTLGSTTYLATHYHETGRLDLAEPLYVETLETQRRVLGDDHIATTETRSNLAVLYAQQGMLERAEPLFREILETRRRTLGEDHGMTLVAEENLGSLYVDTGRAEQALPLWEHGLDARRRIAGDDAIATLDAAARLAALYADLRRDGDAAELYEEVLEGRRGKLGADHEATRDVLQRLAAVRRAQGRDDDAERLLGRLADQGR